MALIPLTIQEAEGKEIKLTNVPPLGATALIPVHSDPHLNDQVRVLIEDEAVVPRVPVGEPQNGFYKVLVSREKLLDHTGANKAFKYIIYVGGLNPLPSETNEYDILHSV
ncbi:hypothetical protein [Pseudomonas sp. LB3P25]